MKRILLTGMSGTGKSSVIAELRKRGYQAVDMDEPGWSEYAPDGEWFWREDRVQEPDAPLVRRAGGADAHRPHRGQHRQPGDHEADADAEERREAVEADPDHRPGGAPDQGQQGEGGDDQESSGAAHRHSLREERDGAPALGGAQAAERNLRTRMAYLRRL